MTKGALVYIALSILALVIIGAFLFGGPLAMVFGGLIGGAMGVVTVNSQVRKTPQEVSKNEKDRIDTADPATVVHDLGGRGAETQRETDVERIIREYRERQRSKGDAD